MELDKILQGNEAKDLADEKAAAKAVETQPETKTDEPAKEERQRDEKGKFAKGEAEPKTETPAVAESDKEPLDPVAKAFYAKAKDERRKRQELEKRLGELERQQNPPAPPPDVLENPKGYAEHLEQQMRFHTLNDRLNLSEELVRDKFGEEAVLAAQELFQTASATDPTLANKLVTERHPYGWLMKWAKGRKFTDEMGDDPEAFLAKKQAEWKAQYDAELSKRVSQHAPPPSLASASSGVSQDTPQWSGPTSLNSILKR